MSVVLPAPLPPTIATNSPGRIVSEMSWRRLRPSLTSLRTLITSTRIPPPLASWTAPPPRSKMKRWSPTMISSPSTISAVPRTDCPFTKVPDVLLRSVSMQRPPSTRTMACRRETVGESNTRSFSGARPTLSSLLRSSSPAMFESSSSKAVRSAFAFRSAATLRTISASSGTSAMILRKSSAETS